MQEKVREREREKGREREREKERMPSGVILIIDLFLFHASHGCFDVKACQLNRPNHSVYRQRTHTSSTLLSVVVIVG